MKLQAQGRYVVSGTLGHGGMGLVLEAIDRKLDRSVAIKILTDDLDEEHARQLLREAQSLAKLSHPSVVQVYEVGRLDEQMYIVMELVRGRTLRTWARTSSPGWRECVEVYAKAAEGLAAAHAQGLVHRDFKPGNAIVDDEGRVRVLDFGLARPVRSMESEGRATHDPSIALECEGEGEGEDEQNPLTQPGTVRGTPGYMPPEQLGGGEVDARSDQFSFCVSLYEALYGERPFASGPMGAMMHAMLEGPARAPPEGSTVPSAVREVLMRGLEAQPELRWPSMDALARELRRLTAPRRGRWVALGLLIGGLATAAGVGVWWPRADGHRCDAVQNLEGIWDASRKKEVETAILGTALSYAPDTWMRVERRLDEYADQWTRAHRRACEATHVHQEQSAELMDLRMACLRDRRVALRESVEVLAQANGTRVEKAVGLVGSLPGLSRCDDVQALQAALPPPEEPAVATRVEALRHRLERARSLQHAGEYDEAWKLAQEILEDATRLGYVPLLAEAKFLVGHLHDQLGRYDEAVAELEQAYFLAAEHGHRTVEREAALQLVNLVGDRQAKHETGLRWGRTALALISEDESEAKADVFASIGTVLSRQGKQSEALESFERGQVILERTVGPRHPDLAIMLNNVGAVLQAQGKHTEALQNLRRALEIFEEALGAGHPMVASSLNNIGNALKREGSLSEALVHHRRALTIKQEVFGPGHPNVALSLNNIGNVLKLQGEPSEALEHYRRALSILSEALGPEHPAVAASQTNIGLVLQEQGQFSEALEQLQAGLAVMEQTLGPQHPQLAFPRIGLARIALAQEDFVAAREHAEQAVSIRESTDVAPVDLAEGHFVLAQALWPDPTSRPRARQLAREARDAYERLGRQEPLARVDAWLAEHP